MYLYVEKGGKEADEREESVATEIKKEYVDEIEEKKQDVERKPKASIFNKDLLIYM